jgi:rubrerythrin
LLSTARGRAFFLNLLADAEIEDEGKVFETLIARVDDADLRKTVRVHHEDEKRHNRMLLECVARNGGAPGPVPPRLRVAHRVDEELGGFFDSFIGGRRGIMEAYVLLLVLEERACVQFPIFVQALQRVDPESAAVMDRVLRDEQRHVLYARAISRRYAPDPATLAETIARFRAAEERAIMAHTSDMITYTLDHDLLAVGLFERLFWRTMTKVVPVSVRTAVEPDLSRASESAVAAS